jgi:hypothetical protein
MTKPKTSYDQRSWNVSEPWIQFMIEAARHYSHRDAATPFLDGIYLRPGYQNYRVRGSILPHTDRASPNGPTSCHSAPTMPFCIAMVIPASASSRACCSSSTSTEGTGLSSIRKAC